MAPRKSIICRPCGILNKIAVFPTQMNKKKQSSNTTEITPTPKQVKEEFKGAELQEIPLDELTPNPYQPRASIDPKSLMNLTASIRQHGVLEPILVAETDDGYKIIAGERRFRASKVAGLTTIPALVKDTTPNEMLLYGLIENLHRKDLNIMEKAHSYQKLAEEFDYTHKEIGDQLGVSRAAITQALRLLNLPQEIQNGLTGGKITEAHGRALLMLKDYPDKCKDLYQEVIEDDLSSTETTKKARQMLSGKKMAKKAPKSTRIRVDAETRGMERMIKEELNTEEVTLKRTKSGSGELTIKFTSDSELKRIFEKITAQ